MLKKGMFTHRLATPADMPALQRLMTAAIRKLLPQFLTPEKVEASFAVMGVDSQLIEDGTYFILEEDGVLAGCGGWSRRATLFGHNHTAGRDSRLLDPAVEPARVRAMYTAPAFVRRGVGRQILQLCEAAARAEGFSRAELGATAGGEPLYRACGYVEIEQLEVPTPGGVTVPITRMGKQI
jgi:GNAT superfamily N-acetyltransferase